MTATGVCLKPSRQDLCVSLKPSRPELMCQFRTLLTRFIKLSQPDLCVSLNSLSHPSQI